MVSFIGYYDVNFFLYGCVCKRKFSSCASLNRSQAILNKNNNKNNLYYIHLEKKMLNLVIANSKTRKKRGYIVITIDIKLLLKQFFNSHLSASSLSLLQRRHQTSSICGWAEEAWNRTTKFPINLGGRRHIRTRQGIPGTRMRMRIKLFILLQSRSQVSLRGGLAPNANFSITLEVTSHHKTPRRLGTRLSLCILTFMALHKGMRKELLISAQTCIRTITWESPQSRAHPTAG